MLTPPHRYEACTEKAGLFQTYSLMALSRHNLSYNNNSYESHHNPDEQSHVRHLSGSFYTTALTVLHCSGNTVCQKGSDFYRHIFSRPVYICLECTILRAAGSFAVVKQASAPIVGFFPLVKYSAACKRSIRKGKILCPNYFYLCWLWYCLLAACHHLASVQNPRKLLLQIRSLVRLPRRLHPTHCNSKYTCRDRGIDPLAIPGRCVLRQMDVFLSAMQSKTVSMFFLLRGAF